MRRGDGQWRGVIAGPGVADRPHAGMGPLGGLNGALHHAAAHGFDAVLAIPVDGFDLPADLIGELSPGPSYAIDAPVIGLWPVAVRGTLDALLAEDTSSFAPRLCRADRRKGCAAVA